MLAGERERECAGVFSTGPAAGYRKVCVFVRLGEVDAGVARWCGDRPRPREVRAGFWMAEIYVSALSLPSVRDSVLEPFFFSFFWLFCTVFEVR